MKEFRERRVAKTAAFLFLSCRDGYLLEGVFGRENYMVLNGRKSKNQTKSGGIKHDFGCDYRRDSALRRSVHTILSAWEAARIQSGTGGWDSDECKSTAEQWVESEGLMDICRKDCSRKICGGSSFLHGRGLIRWGAGAQKLWDEG